MRYMEIFETIDEGVEYLESIGCKMTSDKRDEFVTKSVFKYKDTIVFHDPYGILQG